MSEHKANILLVTGEGGLGDRSFNDAGFAGARRSLKELDIGIDLVELNEIGDLTENTYISAASSNKYDLIIGLGFYQDKTINSTAKMFPNQKFLLIDALSTEPNVRGITFREEENAFLAGILAAYATQQKDLRGINSDKKIGIILGMDAPHLTRYAYSYEAGAKTINADIEVFVDVVGSFINREKGKQLALSQIDRNVDVIYQVAGASGLGVFDAVVEKEVYAIGEGLNQNHLHPRTIIASTYKYMDLTVFEAIKSVIDGEFSGGNYSYGFKDTALEVSLEGSHVPLQKEALCVMETFKQKLINQDIKVPFTEIHLLDYLKTIE